MRWGRNMQKLLKFGLFVGVLTSLWLFYINENDKNLYDVALDNINQFVDLSRFGLRPEVKTTNRDLPKAKTSSSQNGGEKPSKSKRKPRQSDKEDPPISPDVRKKEEQAQVIQDEAIQRAAKIAEENRKREDARLAEDRQKAVEKAKEEEQRAKSKEEARLAEEKRLAEEERLKEEAQVAEEKRMEEKRREEDRIAAERKLEEKRKEEERIAEEKKLEEKRKEEERIAEEKRVEKERLKKEAKKAEEQSKEADSKRVEEKMKEQMIDEAKRRAEENLDKQEKIEEEARVRRAEEKRKKKEYEDKVAAERIAKANRIVEENRKRDASDEMNEIKEKEIKEVNEAKENERKKAELEKKIKEATMRAETEKRKELKRFNESKRKEQERTQEDWKKEQEERFKKIKHINELKKLDDERRAEEENNAEGFIQSFRDKVIRNEDVDIPDVHLAVVACGDRLEESVVLLKSARVLSRAQLHFHIFADDDLRPIFEKELAAWPKKMLEKTTYDIRPLSFPKENSGEWKKLFKPCASQRLFLPDLMPDLDAVLYLDTDILFLRAPEDIWMFFKRFNSTQIAALTPEHEDGNIGWYNRFARHPYYPPLGVNSGVMLMNLTRMRAVDWVSTMIPYHAEYKYRITWGDQDLINIFFHFHPDMVYIYPCHWNFRPDHCMYMSICKYANNNGVNILHGNRRVWFNEKQPAYKAIYTAFKEFEFSDDVEKDLLEKMRSYLMEPIAKNTNCGKLHGIMTKQLELTIKGQTKTSQKQNEGKDPR